MDRSTPPRQLFKLPQKNPFAAPPSPSIRDIPIAERVPERHVPDDYALKLKSLSDELRDLEFPIDDKIMLSTLSAGLGEDLSNAASNLTLLATPTFEQAVAYRASRSAASLGLGRLTPPSPLASPVARPRPALSPLGSAAGLPRSRSLGRPDRPSDRHARPPPLHRARTRPCRRPSRSTALTGRPLPAVGRWASCRRGGAAAMARLPRHRGSRGAPLTVLPAGPNPPGRDSVGSRAPDRPLRWRVWWRWRLVHGHRRSAHMAAHPVASNSGYNYYLVILDDYSHFVWTFPLRRKSDVATTLTAFFAFIFTQFGRPIHALQTDNSKEFDNITIRSLLATHGAVFRLTCPYTSSQNGRAERMLRTLNNCVRTLLFHASMPPRFWPDALATATLLVNIRPCRVRWSYTPHQLLYGVPPAYDDLRIFGCRCYPNTAATAAHKLAPLSLPCVTSATPPTTPRRPLVPAPRARDRPRRPLLALPRSSPRLSGCAALAAAARSALCRFGASLPRRHGAPVLRRRDARGVPGRLPSRASLDRRRRLPAGASPSASPPVVAAPAPMLTRARAGVRRPHTRHPADRTSRGVSISLLAPAAPIAARRRRFFTSSPGPHPVRPVSRPGHSSSASQTALPPDPACRQPGWRPVGDRQPTRNRPTRVRARSDRPATTPRPLLRQVPTSARAAHATRIGVPPCRRNTTRCAVTDLGACSPGPRATSSPANGSSQHKLGSDGTLERYKARWVVRGFRQPRWRRLHGYACPAVKPGTIRTAAPRRVSCLAMHRWTSPTPSFMAICRNRRPYQRIAGFLHQLGFRSTRSDASLFVYRTGHDMAYLLLYVDDIILTAFTAGLLRQLTVFALSLR
ncbi:hypothetical protein QYE76_012081 [Lolium multiflorum]|uniref:Integrase catalytic domain-containing protein n=1 Tax=Lolium multiflorum TaxID=4521 RepID=A0AAD8U158_LOLMU|nr:hypothetical protein QYE76_012081 [Lolium multiflorum]